MIQFMRGVAVGLIWFFGASAFSFLNVVIYRVPRNISFVREMFYCPDCRHRLSAMDVIPVLSWLCLRGRCHYCGERIAPRYIWIELLGGCIALLCIFKTGNNLAGMTAFAFLGMLTAVAFVDLDTMKIPNSFVLGTLVIALVSMVTMPGIPMAERLVGFLSVSLPLTLITLAVPGAFGGGDIKLMAVCGLLLGWKLNLLSLLLAVLTGGIYGMYLLAVKKKGRKEHFAFGPFLCLGMSASLLWGSQIINWYLVLCGLS